MNDTTDWTLAACAGQPTGNWFPEKHTGQNNHGRNAKTICASCPILADCLVGALERNEEHGIWGGAGGDELRPLRRAYTTSPDRWAAALAAHVRNLTAVALDGATAQVTNRNGPGATHGLRVTYNRGCRCRPCLRAVTDERQQRDPAPVTTIHAEPEWTLGGLPAIDESDAA